MRRVAALLVLSLLALLLAQAAELDISRLKTPPGFRVSIFARVPGARMMAFSPAGVLLVTSTESGKVFALPASRRRGEAKPVLVLSDLNRPHGIAFLHGELYLAETDRIRRYAWDERKLRATSPSMVARLPGDGEHFTRTILFARGKLYASVGSDCNVCIERDPDRAAVLEMNEDGRNAHVFASGLRNAVGMALNPRTRTVWVTENGRDELGENIPPDEIDDLGKTGGDFGFPYCYGDRVPDPAYQGEGEKRCPSTIPPVIDLQAHSAPLGLAFYEGTSFPPEYRNSLFVAYHGSWNRRIPTGYKVVRIPLNAKGESQGQVVDFITGWMPDHDRAAVMGRPVDIVFGPDGALYISDDDARVIYRVTYQGGGQSGRME